MCRGYLLILLKERILGVKCFSFMDDSIVSLITLAEFTSNSSFPLRSKEFLADAVTMENIIIKPNKLYRSDCFGVMILEEGNMFYSIGEHEYQIAKGDILFYVPKETFRYLYLSPDIKARQINFSIDMLTEAGFNYRTIDIIKNFSNNISYIIRHEESLFRRLAFHISELAALNDARGTNYYADEMIWHHFSLLMYEIDVFHRAAPEQLNNSSREEELTTSFFNLVRDHYIKHHDVQFYADSLHVSRKYLSRIVKKTMAKSPKDIINQVLLIEAKILLRNSKSNVNQVSEYLNFSEPAVFSKFFKKHSGMNPSDYKMTDLF